MNWDQVFLIGFLLCAVVGLIHVIYYLGYILMWIFCKIFIKRELWQFHKTVAEVLHDIGYDEFGDKNES